MENELNEVSISDKAFSVFGMRAANADWRIDVIAERYADIVKDADRVFGLFTQEEIAYMFRHVEEFDVLTFGPVPFTDQMVWCVEQDLKALEDGVVVSVPVSANKMIEKLNRLTVSEEIALVDGIEKEI